MLRILTVVIQIPALDRLVTYLETKDQAVVDAATTQVQALTQRLAAANTKLGAAIEKEK